MKFSFTLFRYLTFDFFKNFVLTFLVLGFILQAFSFGDLLGDTHSVLYALFFSLLRLPHELIDIFPFCILIATIISFARHAISLEFTATLAMGLSRFFIILPYLFSVLLLSAFYIFVYTPTASIMFERAKNLEASYVSQSHVSSNTMNKSIFSFFGKDLWLKRDDQKERIILRARGIFQHGENLGDVMVLYFSKDNRFLKRYDAQTATFEKGKWVLHNVYVTSNRTHTAFHNEATISNSLTPKDIRASFTNPTNLPIWKLKTFINLTKKAGFSSVSYELYFYKLLATPLTWSGIIFLVAFFFLRLLRGVRLPLLIAGCFFAGLCFFVLEIIISSLTRYSLIVPWLGAWTPALLIFAIGLGLFIKSEEL